MCLFSSFFCSTYLFPSQQCNIPRNIARNASLRCLNVFTSLQSRAHSDIGPPTIRFREARGQCLLFGSSRSGTVSSFKEPSVIRTLKQTAGFPQTRHICYRGTAQTKQIKRRNAEIPPESASSHYTLAHNAMRSLQQ